MNPTSAPEVELVAQSQQLRIAEPEVGPAAAVQDDVQEQAATTVQASAIRKFANLHAGVEGGEVCRFEVHGSVIYSATRSTGQIEEGRVGFSVQAVDGSAVSWRFKPAEQAWPFVLVTSPADRRLVTDPMAADPMRDERAVVRAKVLGIDIDSVVLEVDVEPGMPMQPVEGSVGLWSVALDRLDDGEHRLRVCATDRSGGQDVDTIVVQVGARQAASSPERREHLGEDVQSIGAWVDHDVLGSQLGPNKHGKKW